MIDFMLSVFKGIYPYFSIPALCFAFYRIKTKQWTSTETLLILFVLIHGLTEIFQIVVGAKVLYMSRRYLLPCAPLIFGWFAWGVVHVVMPEIRKLNVKIKQLIFYSFIFIAIFLIVDGVRPIIKTYTSSRKRHERCVVEKLAPILKKMTSSQKKDIEINKNHYIAPYSTYIGSAYPALAYWSSAAHADSANRKCDILVLKSNEEIPRGFTILFSEKIDNIVYKICVPRGKRL